MCPFKFPQYNLCNAVLLVRVSLGEAVDIVHVDVIVLEYIGGYCGIWGGVVES